MSIEFGANLSGIATRRSEMISDKAEPLIETLRDLQPRAGMNDVEVKKIIDVIGGSILAPGLTDADRLRVLGRMRRVFTYQVGD